MTSSRSLELNLTMIKELRLSKQESVLVKQLSKFYNDNIKYFILLNEIIDGENAISRRTFEYFVTKYSDIKKISYKVDNCDFNVYNSYKIQLKKYHKKYFDPFGRGERIPFFMNDDCILTTIGQLNFYKWFFTNNIYDYCFTNYESIQRELLNVKKTSKKKKSVKKPKISSPSYPRIRQEYSDDKPIVVSFDM